MVKGSSEDVTPTAWYVTFYKNIIIILIANPLYNDKSLYVYDVQNLYFGTN